MFVRQSVKSHQSRRNYAVKSIPHPITLKIYIKMKCAILAMQCNSSDCFYQWNGIIVQKISIYVTFHMTYVFMYIYKFILMETDKRFHPQMYNLTSAKFQLEL